MTQTKAGKVIQLTIDSWSEGSVIFALTESGRVFRRDNRENEWTEIELPNPCKAEDF